MLTHNPRLPPVPTPPQLPHRSQLRARRAAQRSTDMANLERPLDILRRLNQHANIVSCLEPRTTQSRPTMPWRTSTKVVHRLKDRSDQVPITWSQGSEPVD